MLSKLNGLFIVFGIVTLLSFGLRDQFTAWKIDYKVVLGANTLLFLIGIISLLLHIRALRNPNPQVFIRSIMIANILKILSLATAALMYISTSNKATNTRAVFAGLFLYIIYTWVEKRATIQLSKSKK